MISNQYSSQVNFARALCLGANVLNGENQKPFNNGTVKYDILVWLDSDMVYTPSMIDKLIQNGMVHGVYSGIYALDGGTQLCCVEDWDETYYKDNGSFKFLSVSEGEDRIRQNKSVVNCAYVGMGCMAIKHGIIEDERFKYPWFFRNITCFGNDDNMITDGSSEDVSFMRNLVESGIIDSIPVDLSLRFGHEKSIVY
jgi:choline kinase